MLVWAEPVVRSFARYRKYTIGLQLRFQALAICRLVSRAQALGSGERVKVVRDLHLAAEQLKLLLQLGRKVKAFKSWMEFEQRVDLAPQIARQSAGWRRVLDKAQTPVDDDGLEGIGVRRAEARQRA